MISIRLLAALLISSFLATSALAQDRRVPSSAAELRLSYAPIVQRVQPAVVNVYAAKTVQDRNPLLDDPIFRRFFGVPGQMPEQVQRSLGSGVMVDASGLVVTNNHVIEGADQVKVSLSDKREFEAEIVLKDSRSDLAVLHLKDVHEKFPTLDFANSDELQVGDVVLAIGNPFGVGQTVTHGIISALARTQVGITDYQFFIQTDAAINPGNSGGALVDMTGKLAVRRLARYRLCDPRQHGARRGGLGPKRRQGREAAVARRAVAGSDAGDRRDDWAAPSERRARCQRRSRQSGGARRAQAVGLDRRHRRASGRRSQCL
jgi:S1-C subfamily serine protease